MKNGKVGYIKVSPDMQKIAYVADQDINNHYQVYIANADGSVNIRVSPENASGDTDLRDWSDGSYVTFAHGSLVYRASFDASGVDVSFVGSDSMDDNPFHRGGG